MLSCPEPQLSKGNPCARCLFPLPLCSSSSFHPPALGPVARWLLALLCAFLVHLFVLGRSGEKMQFIHPRQPVASGRNQSLLAMSEQAREDLLNGWKEESSRNHTNWREVFTYKSLVPARLGQRAQGNKSYSPLVPKHGKYPSRRTQVPKLHGSSLSPFAAHHLSAKKTAARKVFEAPNNQPEQLTQPEHPSFLGCPRIPC